MYQIGAYVVYGVQGVCRVLGKEKQLVNRKRIEYLVLEPLTRGESRYYLPTGNPTAMAKIQPLLTAQELTELLTSDEIRKDCWIKEENMRKQRYRDLIGSGDRIALLQMIHALYRYKEEQVAAGRKFHQCDDNFLRDAERLICSEISMVLSMQIDEAKDYLHSHIA